jgi:hypothetical protein
MTEETTPAFEPTPTSNLSVGNDTTPEATTTDDAGNPQFSQDEWNKLVGIEDEAEESDGDWRDNVVEEKAEEETSEEPEEEKSAETTEEETEEESETEEPVKVILRVNGKRVEATPEDVEALAQKYLASEQRLEKSKETIREAHQMRENVTAAMNEMNSGDTGRFVQTLIANGVKPELLQKYVIEIAAQMYDYEQMDPAARRAHDAEQEAARLRAEKESREAELKKRDEAYADSRASNFLMEEIPGALHAEGLPNTAPVIRRFAEVWSLAIQQGNPGVTAKQVARYVKKELERDYGQMLPHLPDEVVEKQLAPRIEKKVAKEIEKRVPKKAVAKKAPTEKRAKDNGYMLYSEWRKGRSVI